MRLLLQFMALPSAELSLESEILRDVATRETRSFLRDCKKAEELGVLATTRVELRQASVVRLSSRGGRAVCQYLHYLRIPRRKSLHWALVEPTFPGAPIAYFCISPSGYDARRWDLPALAGLDAPTTAFLSRSYSSPLAPRNAISFLMGRVRKEMVISSPHTRHLITTVDSELGFNGASYSASGFRLVGRTPPTLRMYLDGKHCTPGQLFHRFGSADLDHLRDMLGDRLHVLQDPASQVIFATDLER